MAIYGSLGEVNLTSLSASISDTAVDIFVYDTSKDSDGGAWRKRTQHTSWYNETLNTATRGSRREFPAVAVLVMEYEKLTIYDGDDPDLPMWMKFEYGNINLPNMKMLYSNGTAVTALNGIVCCTGTASWHDGLTEINFIQDFSRFRNSSNITDWTGGIGTRNIIGGYKYFYNISSMYIVSSNVNDVKMTVLPNAPIDETTGLPIPTIAVATDGGVSVIKDDGTVVDWTESTGPDSTHRVSFRNDGKLGVFTSGTSGINNYPQAYYITIPSTDVSASFYYNFNSLGIEKYGYENETNSSARLAMKGNLNAQLVDLVDSSDRTYAATNAALNIISRPESVGTTADMTTGMIDFVTSSYNTGWMHGDIKGAFLSDTDATNVTSSNLMSGATYFSQDRITSYSYTSGSNTLAIDDDEATTDGHATLRLGGLESSTTYVVSYTTDNTYTPTPGYTPHVHIRDEGGTTINTKYFDTSQTGSGQGNLTFTTSTGDPLLVLYSGYSGGNLTFTIELRLAEEDRSVNNKGLQVFGTVTKSAVATGAELVAYSGWSTSNYLLQPHNTDLEFGGGDFTIMYWFNGPGRTNGYHLYHSTSGNSVPKWETSNQGAGYIRFYDSIAGGMNITGFSDNVWNQVVIVRSSGVLYGYMNGEFNISKSCVGSLTNTSAELVVGNRHDTADRYSADDLALLRISKTAASPEQIKKMYEDEKVLFQENSACTLYGSSDAVTALANDDSTNLLYAGTSSGRSDFQGLRRINNTTTAVTTAISASNGLIAEQ